MKCILHIGTEKTGTTTLQHFLYANIAALKEQGFGILKSMGKGNNRRLASYGMRDGRLQDDYFLMHGIRTESEKKEHDRETELLLKNELNELNESGCHTIIISSEHFHSRCELDDEVKKVANLLKEFFHEIKVVCYLRPQVDVASSLYTTVLRSGAKLEFEDFIEKHCREDNFYYNYQELLERWSRVFGQYSICPRLLEPEKLKDQDLVKDFLSLSGVKSSHNIRFYHRENESLTVFGQELLRLNNVYQHEFAYKGESFKEYVYKKANSLFAGRGASLDQSQARKLQAQFDAINNSVARQWFSSDSLFEINYEKYQKKLPPQPEKDILEDLFSTQHLIKEVSGKNVKHSTGLENLAGRITHEFKSADILREVAFAFEQSDDIQTAFKVMEQAHLLRPQGPVIKQKLEEYRNILNDKTAPAIPPEGIETINALGHRDYVGGLWEEIGQLQFDFMVAQGLQPEHTLLDIGCGSLRGGIHFINYVNSNNYLGVDKERELINRGVELELGKELLAEKQPEFIVNNHFGFDKFSKVPDFAIAHALFTHLVEHDIRLCLVNLKKFAGDKPLTFFASFFEIETPKVVEFEASHSHTKFEYTRTQMEQFGLEAGWQVEYIGDWNHPRGQRMIKYYI